MYLTIEHIEPPPDPLAFLPGANSIRRVLARQQINAFEDACARELSQGSAFAPAVCGLKHMFSERHPMFGCHIYAREMSAPAGAILVGRIHKYPVMHILLKGSVASVTDMGGNVAHAPAYFMAGPGIKRVGYVLEDCVWVNVILSNDAGDEHIDDIVDFHTAGSYAEAGLDASIVDAIERIKARGV